MTGFASLDPLLPPAVDAGEGERLCVRLPDGREAEGLLYRARYAGWESLWRARETWELTPLPSATGYEATAALVAALRTRLRAASPAPDSACALTWPSRDTGAARALLEYGFAPWTVLAVRVPGGSEPAHGDPAGVTVRPAAVGDLDEVTALWLAELRYSALLGAAFEREGAPELLRAELHRAIGAGEPVWLADADGIPVGLAVCGRPAGHPRLPHGRWGHLGTMSVAEPAREAGIGRTLLATVHRELLAGGVHGTYLFYSPHNPLASVFWHRHGYRPLWTTWEARPANALLRDPP